MAGISTERSKGIMFILVSAVVFSTAGLFTKGVDTDAWGVIFWRGLSAAGFTIIYLIIRGQLRNEIRAMIRPSWVIVLMMSLGTAAFIPAFKYSTIANVSLIYSACPIIAGVISWLVLKEKPTRRVIIASILTFLGVLIIVSGSLGSIHLIGDLLALFMTFMMASVVVVYRKHPEVTAALPAALSSILLLPASYFMIDFSAVIHSDISILLIFGLVFAVASVTFSEGARRLPSAETALLSSLEVPLAPILAFLVLSEVPAYQSWIGGAIILTVIIWSQLKER